jgi:hypothetical protein
MWFNCKIAFITITHVDLYSKAAFHAPSSTYHHDLHVSHMIIDVDMNDADIPIVIYVYHYMILLIAISWFSMQICVCALVNISQWTTHIRHIYERYTDHLLCSNELVPLSMHSIHSSIRKLSGVAMPEAFISALFRNWDDT